MKDKKKAAIAGGVLVAVAVVSFLGGMQFGKADRGFGQGIQSERGFGQGAMMGSGSTRTGARAAGGFTSGSILSIDSSSMTVQMQDGSTKIILISPSTEITKSAKGSLEDLAKGTSVLVTGTSNSDGSLTAQTVQIRPAGAQPAAMMQGGQISQPQQ